MKNRIPAAEVLLKLDHLTWTFLPCIGGIFFHKKLRSCQTEPVDALLHVSYHKHVWMADPLSGNAADQRFLHQIAVLVLIHQNLLVLAAQFLCCRRRLSGYLPCSLFLLPVHVPVLLMNLFQQYLQRQMLQIIKIQHISLPLCLPVRLIKAFSHIQKHPDHGLCSCDSLDGLLRVLKPIAVPAFLRSLLYTGAAAAYILLFFRVNLLASGRCQTVKGKLAQRLMHFLKAAALCRLFYRLKAHNILFQHRLVDPGAVLLPTHLKGVPDLLCQFSHLKSRIP